MVLSKVILGLYFIVIIILNIGVINLCYTLIRVALKVLINGHSVSDSFCDTFPMVTFQIPIYNERPEMISTLLQSVADQCYPSQKLEILILDQSDDNLIIRELTAVVQQFQQMSDIDLKLIKVDRVGDPHDTSTQYKAGSLNLAINQFTRGEIIVVLDGDSYLAPDFLKHAVRHFSRPEVGIVVPRVTVHSRHHDILACWVRISNHLNFIIGSIRSVIGFPLTFIGNGILLRRTVIEQFRWDTIHEDSCMGLYASTIGKWTIWFDDKAVVFDEGIPYSFKDVKNKWARITHGQCQTFKKIINDQEYRRIFFTNFQAMIYIGYTFFIPYISLCFPIVVFLFFLSGVQFNPLLENLLMVISFLGLLNILSIVYIVFKYTNVHDLLYFLISPLVVIVCLVPGFIAFTKSLWGKSRPFYRVQRFNNAIPSVETGIKIIEAGMAMFSFSAILFLWPTPSAIIFYMVYFIIMVLSFTNIRIPPRVCLTPSLYQELNERNATYCNPKSSLMNPRITVSAFSFLLFFYFR